ncbi:helix-turn-helix domain-containing protein [Cohnella sp. GbtcB17]|uniref:helix-turn-helix domain-containing protein n=1 Tax=Cohnella sp. GbtcB17 TaxID=2824762 RepID=UPI001C2F27D8|nr:helix-turn-helix domain-containing protein [Cohnella sp. GbtcB17]
MHIELQHKTEASAVGETHADADMHIELRDLFRRSAQPQVEVFESYRSDDYWLIVVKEGEAHIVVRHQIHVVSAEEIFICGPGQPIEFMPSARQCGDVYIYRFAISAAIDDGPAADKLWSPSATVSLTPASFTGIVSLCENIHTCWQAANRLQRLRSRASFYELAYRVLLERTASPEQGLRAVLNRVKSYMEAHFQEAITAGKLADMAGISPSHFMHSFKKIYGRSAMDYLAELRMVRARQMLMEGERSVREIAYQVGYNDEFYFRRSFKKQVGVPPAVYWKNRQLKVAAYSWDNIGQLLALQIIPHAAPIDHYWTNHYRRKYQSDVIVPLSHSYDANMEALRKAGVDHIVAVDFYVPPEQRQRLSAIAPTLFLPWETVDWRAHLRMIGQFLDKTEAAETWLAQYERKASDIRNRVKAALRDETVLVLDIYKGTPYIYGRKFATVLYDDLAVEPAGPAGEPVWWMQASADMLTDIDADHIVLITDDHPGNRDQWRTLKQSAQWQGLTAVRSRRTYPVQRFPWMEYAAFNHLCLLDELQKLFVQDRP